MTRRERWLVMRDLSVLALTVIATVLGTFYLAPIVLTWLFFR